MNVLSILVLILDNNNTKPNTLSVYESTGCLIQHLMETKKNTSSRRDHSTGVCV